MLPPGEAEPRRGRAIGTRGMPTPRALPTPRILRMIGDPTFRDADDRPLRECRTPAEHLRPGDIQHKTCPYRGSRYRHAQPMNASALRQASTHWDDVIDAMALLRQLHADARGGAAPELMDLWRASQLGAALPWYHLLRACGEAPAPGYSAALAKACQGVGVWAQRVLADRLTGAPVPAEFTPDTILASTEGNRTLIGETEVCAGSEAMLKRFFAAMIDGQPTLTSAPIAKLADERDALLLFGAHYAGLKLLLWLLSLARQFVYADLAAALGPTHQHAPAIAALMAAGCDPPDFDAIALPDPAAVPLACRAGWLARLAMLVVPFAPDGSDRALAVSALAIAHACGADDAPADLAAEVAALAGLGSTAAALAARAIATYARLDAILGVVAMAVETAFARSDGDSEPVPRLSAAMRDRLLTSPPRTLLAMLAPAGLAGRCPP